MRLLLPVSSASATAVSSLPEPIGQYDVHEDAVRAIRFMAMKATIFILIPLLAALIAVGWRFG